MRYKNFRYTLPLVLWGLLASTFATAGSGGLENYIIQSGPNVGKRLLDVVEKYRINGIRIPTRAIEDSFTFYDRYRNSYQTHQSMDDLHEGLYPSPIPVTSPVIANRRYMVIFDLDKISSKPRLHLIDLKTGKIRSTWAAHGKGSDCGNGRACNFKNFDGISGRYSQHPIQKQTTLSPLGFFSTGPVTNGFPERPNAITLRGLEAPTPDGFTGNEYVSSASTGLIIHSASYVSKGYVKKPSDGCPAMNKQVFDQWKPYLKGGALFYFYSSQLDSMKRSYDVPGLAPVSDNSTALAHARDPRISSDQIYKPYSPMAPSSAEGPCPPGVPAGTVCEALDRDAK